MMEVLDLIEPFELEVHSFCFSDVGSNRQVHLVPLGYVVLIFLLDFDLGEPLL